MEVSKIIAIEVASLPLEKQAEVIDFIKLLKAKQNRGEQTAAPKTAEEIAAFSVASMLIQAVSNSTGMRQMHANIQHGQVIEATLTVTNPFQ